MKVSVAIVGAGITGLAAATWLRHDHGLEDFVVLDQADRAGGKIRSETEHGFCLEWGPQGFLDNAADTLELVRLCGADQQLVSADDAAAARFIVRGGALRPVPTSPLAFLTSNILSLAGRLRVLGEPFVRTPAPEEESVFDFARRRIGREAAEVLVDAMVTGVFAGDSRELALAATFPRMAAMEAAHGSLTRALIAKKREARRHGRRAAGPAGPGGTLCSFASGMSHLPARLADGLGQRLRLSCPIRSISRREQGFVVAGDGLEVRADAVLLTTPAAVTARLIRGLAPAAVDPLKVIRTVPIAVVMSAYANPGAFGRSLGGFGFLVPGCERLPILGTLFCHAIFPVHAAPGHLFLRTMLGGARNPELLAEDDATLVGHVRRTLAKVLGADPEPDHLWVVRWQEGISQYSLGHLKRVEQIEGAAATAGIELAGSPLRGVSVNDCVRQGRAAAGRLAERALRPN